MQSDLSPLIFGNSRFNGRMDGLPCVETPPTGQTRLTDWMRENAGGLGRRYASELARRRDRQSAY